MVDHVHPEGQASCEACLSSGPVSLYARCHPMAPPRAWLEGNTMTFICSWPDCGLQVAVFKIIKGGN